MFEYLLQGGEAVRPGPPWEAVPSAISLTLWRVGEVMARLVEAPAWPGRIEARLARGELVLYRRARTVSIGARSPVVDPTSVEPPIDLADLADAEPDDPQPPIDPAPARPTWIERSSSSMPTTRRSRADAGCWSSRTDRDARERSMPRA